MFDTEQNETYLLFDVSKLESMIRVSRHSAASPDITVRRNSPILLESDI